VVPGELLGEAAVAKLVKLAGLLKEWLEHY